MCSLPSIALRSMLGYFRALPPGAEMWLAMALRLKGTTSSTMEIHANAPGFGLMLSLGDA
jgi:hypothetical protein